MFDAYIAVGDSMSIDFYAFNDAVQKGQVCREAIGAASLLFTNESNIFPEFAGRDLQTMFSGIQHENICADGDTCQDVLSNQRLEHLSEKFQDKVLITLTIGGNDLLLAFRKSTTEGPSALTNGLEQLQKNYFMVLTKIQKLFPRATLITASVYDPTDGTGVLPTGSPLFAGQLPVDYLDQFNDFVRAISARRGFLYADIRKHFVGHGALCGSANNFWYFPPSPIEASYIGSSEIRRVWLDALSLL
ncbi:MAG: SGNH/GDSL hydrolase family protein [Candidatus Obscuribacterales bacterium]|nr:SGNH/GDSL hydrolase family protein [Candidatus Obscuribacterales bacterium]